MDPQRWQEIERLYNAVLDCESRDRPRLLDSADPEVKREVEQMLAQDGSLLDWPAWQALSDSTTTMPMPAGEQLNHYKIIAKLGAGGMGEVYEALDTKLDRRVAIKLLYGSHPLGNLLKEARAVAKLNHPNIVTIYELGSAAGKTFLVMEKVEGETLRARLAKGQLESDQVREFGMQISSALMAAHAAGIVHRDIKPANLMVTSHGQIKVMDFGLARTISSDPNSTPSLSGRIIGTPAYLSPEQAQGESATEQSDLFAVGAVLYEALSGRRAFTGENPAECIAAILRDEPAPLPDTVPTALRLLIQRCLRKKPAERFATAEELHASLANARCDPSSPDGEVSLGSSSGKAPLSIAVLPFENWSGDKENEFFGDGLAEDILNALAKLSDWRVASRTSAFAFRDVQSRDLGRIGRLLRVDYVLEGSVRRTSKRLRIAVQLVRIQDGAHLWSERYDRELADLFEVQDEISSSVVDALNGKFVVKPALAINRTRNLEASQWFWKGRYHMAQATKESLSLAVGEFEQAIRLDPDYAEPHAGLATFYNLLAYLHLAPAREVVPLARKFALRALELAPELDEASEVLAATKLTLDYDWAGANEIFTKVLANPRVSPRTRYRYAFQYLLPLGQYDRAIELNESAVTEDPLAPLAQGCLAACYYFSRRYENCIELAEKQLNGPVNFWVVDLWAGTSLMALGRLEEASICIRRAKQRGPADALMSALLGLCLRRLGRRDEAQTVWQQASNKSAFSEAFFDIDDADPEFVLDLLHQQITDRHQSSARVGVDPLWDRFRFHPRYAEALRRMNLSVYLEPLTKASRNAS